LKSEDAIEPAAGQQIVSEQMMVPRHSSAASFLSPGLLAKEHATEYIGPEDW
jgi:hypothetical protein